MTNKDDEAVRQTTTEETSPQEDLPLHEIFTLDELDFEMELALERSTTLEAADRLLRSGRDPALATPWIQRRYSTFH